MVLPGVAPRAALTAAPTSSRAPSLRASGVSSRFWIAPLAGTGSIPPTATEPTWTPGAIAFPRSEAGAAAHASPAATSKATIVRIIAGGVSHVLQRVSTIPSGPLRTVSSPHAARHLAPRALLPRRRQCPRNGIVNRRRDRFGPHPKGVWRRGGGAALPRRRVAGTRSAGARGHGRRRRAPPDGDRRRQADLRARRLRRGRDLRHRARRPAAARGRRRRRLAPAVALRGGLRPQRADAHPAGRG